MIKVSDIRSVGWLNSVSDVILTPVLNNSSFPIKVRVSNAEFNKMYGDELLIKQKACDLLNRVHK
jgi:hypothetical protein